MLESINTAEHQGASDFQWDARGRFFTSIVSSWRGNGEAGYSLWNFNGKLLGMCLVFCLLLDSSVFFSAKFNKPKFYEFHWRPRPASLLTNKEEKQVLKKMKDATARFAKEDELRRRLERKDFFIQRLATRKAYYDNLKALQTEYEEQAKKHQKLFAKLQGEEELETVVEMVETVVDEKTTIL
jgi:translation initiation factor 3 subunit B